MSQKHAAVIQAANARLIGEGDLNAVGNYFASDYVAHVTGQEYTGGYAVVEKILRAYQRAFSDIEVDIEILVSSKERIAWIRTLKAKHTGPFKGFPASDRTIVWQDMVTSEFRDGLIAKEWVVTDLAEKLLLARK